MKILKATVVSVLVGALLLLVGVVPSQADSCTSSGGFDGIGHNAVAGASAGAAGSSGVGGLAGSIGSSIASATSSAAAGSAPAGTSVSLGAPGASASNTAGGGPSDGAPAGLEGKMDSVGVSAAAPTPSALQ